MSWIEEINYLKAGGELKKIYDQQKNSGGTIDNVLSVHSLRPNTMTGHLSLYKNVLHHSANTLPKWFLEAIGVYVSFLNKCDYCFEHHSRGMKKLLNDENESEQILGAIKSGLIENYFSAKELEGLRYAKKLTLAIVEVNEQDILSMRNSGFADGEILEINQVVSYFNYANRVVLGLGVELEK